MGRNRECSVKFWMWGFFCAKVVKRLDEHIFWQHMYMYLFQYTKQAIMVLTKSNLLLLTY